MSDISLMLTQLEIAINAVEPRVLEDYHPGLSDAEIDAIMVGEPFKLPDDLRALYRWRNGEDGRNGFLGSFIQMLPLATSFDTIEGNQPTFTLKDKSHYIREEVRMWFEMIKEPPPINLDETEFFYLFDTFGDGSSHVALWQKSERDICEVWTFDTGDFPFFYRAFDNLESMIETALAWWKNGVFTPREHQFGWDLNVDWEKYGELGKQFNPHCSHWEEDEPTISE